MDSYQILAMFAGALIVGNTLPQLYKILKTKEVDELSLSMFIMVLLAEVIWLAYGFHLKDLPLIITNGLASLVVATNVGLILRYRVVPAKN